MSALAAPSFGSVLRHYRMATHLTQEELAERSGVSPRAVIALERGERRKPYRYTVALLAAGLQLSSRDAELLHRAAGYLPAAPERVERDPLLSLLPLLGRSRELAIVERALAGPAPPVLLFAGEPGIGKSRLLQEAERMASEMGFSVLCGGGQRRSGLEPYSPLLETLSRSLAGRSTSQLRVALAGCGWLTRLLPELVEIARVPLPAGTLPPEQERRLVFAAVARYLVNIAGPAGTVLILDDLQWSSPDGLDLLASLVQQADGAHLRIIGAYRVTEVGHDHHLSALLAELAEQELVHQLTLDPLDEAAALSLLDGLLQRQGRVDAREIKQRIVQRAGGVPFFLVSCVHALDVDDQGESVPWSVGQSIRQRVAALPPAAQETLGIAAVVGRVVPRRILAGVATGPEDEVLAALDLNCQARLLEESGEDAYRFVHDILREVVEDTLSAARRSVLHRRVAQVLEQWPTGPPLEVVAFHYSRSDAREKAALYLEEAGDRALAQHAHASAAAHYRDLVHLIDELRRTRDSAPAYEKLGVALRLAGDYDAALPAFERAVTMYHVLGDREGEHRTLAQIGWVYATRGTLDDGFSRFAPVLGRLDAETPSPGLAALYTALTRLYDLAGRPLEQLAAAERASEIARAVGDKGCLATAQAVRGNVLVTFERYGEGVQAGEEAVRLAETTDDLAALNIGLTTIGYASLLLGNLDTARAATDRAVVVAEQWGDPEVMLEARCFRATVALHTEEWALARADAEVAVSLGRRHGLANPIAWALVIHATCCARMGDWDHAAPSLEECLEIAKRQGNAHTLCFVQTQLAEHDLLTEHAGEACARLAPFAHQLSAQDRMSTWFLPALAWAYLEVGELDKAEDVFAPAVAHTRATCNRVGLVEALRVQAMTAIRRRRWEEAKQTLEEGVLIAHTMRYPYGEGRLLQAFGQLHIARGEQEQAKQRLEQALGIFGRLGAGPYIERSERLLDTLDCRQRHRGNHSH